MSSRLRLHFPIVYRRLCLCDKSVNLGLKPDRLSKNVIGVEKHPRIGECCALLLQFSTLLLNKASDDVLIRTATIHDGPKKPLGRRSSYIFKAPRSRVMRRRAHSCPFPKWARARHMDYCSSQANFVPIIAPAVLKTQLWFMRRDSHYIMIILLATRIFC